MEVGVQINENNQVVLVFLDTVSGIRVNIDSEIINNMENGYCYKYVDGEFIRDTQKETMVQNLIEIDILKQKLADTDYIVTKSMEYQITGKPIPDECNQILIDRDSWRNRINILQSEIEE